MGKYIVADNEEPHAIRARSRALSVGLRLVRELLNQAVQGLAAWVAMGPSENKIAEQRRREAYPHRQICS